MASRSADEQIKGAEALTFAAALVGLSGISLRSVWNFDAGDKFALYIILPFAVPFLILIIYAASRCILIGTAVFIPLFSDEFLAVMYAVYLTLFVAFTPWADDPKITPGEDRSELSCTTLKCVFLRNIGPKKAVD